MEVVYEDNHIIIVNKESGEIVQGDKTGDTPLSDIVKQYIKEKYQKPGEVFLGVVHRLDRPVSGLVVFARTSKALTRLNKMFADKEQIKKTYWAITEKTASPPTPLQRERGVFRSDSTDFQGENVTTPLSILCKQSQQAGARRGAGGGVFEATHYLVRNEKQNKSYAYDHEVPHSKKAMLRYRVLATGDRYHLVEIQLLTGRHHQIRCQLAALGCPIKGDLKYGARRSNPDGGISLQSHRIEFIHPVSKKLISIEAPLPHDPLWEKLMNADH